MERVKAEIKALASKYKRDLHLKIDGRSTEMESDDNSHYLIYKVLGIPTEEGKLIDLYQNKGRFLYKYAGSFLEEAAILCFQAAYPDAKKKIKIKNILGIKPKTFEIDCLIKNFAFEIKWKDATTDGDHITKEHTRVKAIKQAGYKPMRIMFYYPHRKQAIRIQETLQTIYKGVEGEYYFGEGAWNYIKKFTQIDLKKILEDIAKENFDK